MSQLPACTILCLLFLLPALGASPVPDPMLDRAARLVAAGEKTEAIGLLSAYEAARPQDLQTLSLLGHAQFAALDVLAAAGTFRTALALDPSCDTCRAQLAESLLVTGDLAGAAEVYANAPTFEHFAQAYASVRRESELAAGVRSSHVRLGLCALAIAAGWASVIAALAYVIGRSPQVADQLRGISRTPPPRA